MFGQEFEAEMKLSGLSWRSCEGSKRVIGPLQAGRSTRYPATNETPAGFHSFVSFTGMVLFIHPNKAKSSLVFHLVFVGGTLRDDRVKPWPQSFNEYYLR